MSTPRRGRRLEAVEQRESVSPLELFFDLVFVFALTQVTEFMAAESSARRRPARHPDDHRAVVVLDRLLLAVQRGAGRAGVHAARDVRRDGGHVRPGHHDSRGVRRPAGGLHGPVVFAVCYFVVRAVHIVMFWVASRDDPQLRGQLLRFLPSMLAGTILLLIASQTTGTTQTVLWFGRPRRRLPRHARWRAPGWRMGSASHFAERHGLIIIVALGESIVAIGVGVAHLPISWPIIAASVLGLVVARRHVVGLLRRHRADHRTRAGRGARASGRSSSRAAATRSCTCRWSSASS